MTAQPSSLAETGKTPASGDKRSLALLLLLATLLIVPPALINPMASFDEAWYASVARNILRTGEVLTLEYNGQPFHDKPPLSVWPTAAFFALLGEHDFVARLSAILCGLACVSVVYWFARGIGGSLVGLLAGLTLLTAQDFLRFAAKGQTDVPLTLLITAQLVLFWKGRDNPHLYWWSGLCAGLAVATKNQVGLCGCLIQGLYILLAGDFRPLRQWQWYLSQLLAPVILVPWMVYQYWLFGPDFLTQYFHYNYASQAAGRTADAFGYLSYLAARHNVLLVSIVAGLVWAAVRFLRHADRLPVLLAVWVLAVPTVFACFGQGADKYWYLIPIYPGAALLIAFALAGSRPWQRHPRYVLGAVAIWALIFQVSYYVPLPKQTALWSAKHLAQVVRESTVPGEKVYLLHDSSQQGQKPIHLPAAHYYFDRPIVVVQAPVQLKEPNDSAKPIVAVANKHTLETCYAPVLRERRHIAIFQDAHFSCIRIQPPCSQLTSQR